MTTGVYTDKSANDFQKATNAQHGDTIPSIELLGGDYWIIAVAASWNSGSLDFVVTAPDGTTTVSVLAAAFAANGIKTVTLPPCTLQPVITTTDGLYWSLVRITRK